MPDFDDLPFDDVSRAAADAATEPDFAGLAARGVRRRNRRRTSYAGLAAVVLIGTVSAVQLAGGDGDSAPDPAPDPDVPAALVFTRGDDSTFSPTELTVECQRVDGAMLVLVSGPFTDAAGIDPERSEPTISGYLGLQMPLADVRDGAQLAMPDPSGRAAWRLFADDPTTDDMWNSREPHSSGVIQVESARCGSVPAIVFEVDGVLGSGAGDATVSVTGSVKLEGKKPLENLPATGIVDDPDSRFVALAVSGDDPDIQAAVWQRCRAADDCVEKYAVVVTRDAFATRNVVDRVFGSGPSIAAAGPAFHVISGLGPGEFLKPDGSLVDIQPGPVTSPDAVIPIGSGLPLWTIFDGENLTAAPLPQGAPETRGITVLSDGSLAGIEYVDEAAFVRSTDLGRTWSRTTLDAGDNALFSVIDGGDGRAVVIEGSDGATLFPFVAVHRQEAAGGPFTRFAPDSDPRAYISGSAVLPDGRLLIGVESWSDERSSVEAVTRPGLYVSAGDDWSTFEEIAVGAPWTELDIFRASWLATTRTEDSVTIFLAGDHPAYSSSDGGQTWQAVPGR